MLVGSNSLQWQRSSTRDRVTSSVLLPSLARPHSRRAVACRADASKHTLVLYTEPGA